MEIGPGLWTPLFWPWLLILDDVKESRTGDLNMTWLWSILEQLAARWADFVINLGATFAGVFLALWLEGWLSRNKEKDDFGKVLQSLATENANNLARLEGIKDCSVSMIPGFSLSNQLALAVGSPLFHRWAKHSLVLAASILSTHIEFVNNLLARLRAASENQILEQTIEELKGAAKRAQELIHVMQELISDELPEFGGHPKADAKTNETREKLRSIMYGEVNKP
jgi:hypothetical protein